jgi:hypothetical protein
MGCLLRACIKTKALRAVAESQLNDAFWNQSRSARLLAPEMHIYLALEEFLQEVL